MGSTGATRWSCAHDDRLSDGQDTQQRKMITHCIDELPELFLPAGIIGDDLPLVVERSYELIHLALQVRADSQLVIEQDFLESLGSMITNVIERKRIIETRRTSIPPSICSTHRAVRISLSAVRM